LEAGEKFERKSKYQEKLIPAKKMDDKYKIDYNVETQSTGNEGPGEGPSATFIPK